MVNVFLLLVLFLYASENKWFFDINPKGLTSNQCYFVNESLIYLIVLNVNFTKLIANITFDKSKLIYEVVWYFDS